MKFSEIKVGDTASLRVMITKREMNLFFDITDDFNPIHAGKDGIVYGMLTASYISALIGNHLPGDGAVWKSQTLKFVAPVHIEDTITVMGWVIDRDAERKEITIYTDIYNQRDEVVLYGTAVVKCTR
jgi:3-hydroxybutyryl-CoA dehydratase